MPISNSHLHDDLLKIMDMVDRLAHQVEDLTERSGRWAAESEERDKKLMATLDDLVAAASAEDTKIDSLIALVMELKAKVDAIVAGELTPAQQAQIDAAFAAISDNPDRIQAAIDANTPAP